MSTNEIIMAVLSTAGFTSVGTALVLKTFLETGIKESIGSVYKKQLEDHKFLLKNSEKVFQFKLDASRSLYKIFHEILPRGRRGVVFKYITFDLINPVYSC